VTDPAVRPRGSRGTGGRSSRPGRGHPGLLLLPALLALHAAPAVAQPTVDTTILSFNIRYGRADDGPDSWEHRRELVCATIAAHAPAIFGVQECLWEQGEVLRAAFPGHEFTGYGRDDGEQAGEMCAIFTDRGRYDVLDRGVFWLSETPDVVGSRGWDAALPRIATWVMLRDSQGLPDTVFVFNAHFDHVGEKARERSAVVLRERVGAIAGDHAVVVLGDFNADADSPPHRVLTGGAAALADAWACAGDEEQSIPGTFHGFTGRPERGRIDWILSSPRLPCRTAGIDRSARSGHFPSDHFAVWAVFRQPRRNP
jgi:endonuclease/exonuclease/phosphatase family metal-dependent hydrolase